jgi:hypothetical protein
MTNKLQGERFLIVILFSLNETKALAYSKENG